MNLLKPQVKYSITESGRRVTEVFDKHNGYTRIVDDEWLSFDEVTGMLEYNRKMGKRDW